MYTAYTTLADLVYELLSLEIPFPIYYGIVPEDVQLPAIAFEISAFNLDRTQTDPLNSVSFTITLVGMSSSVITQLEMVDRINRLNSITGKTFHDIVIDYLNIEDVSVSHETLEGSDELFYSVIATISVVLRSETCHDM